MSAVITPEQNSLLGRDKPAHNSKAPRNGAQLQWLLLSVIVFLIVTGGLRLLSANSSTAEETVKVVAAGCDIPPGCRVGFTGLHYSKIPKRYFNEDMFTSYEQVAGLTTRFFVPKGEPIRHCDLLQAGGTLAGIISPNTRAITLRLDQEALIDHAAYPGDHVDVLVTVNKNSKRSTRTVCQDLPVLLSVPREMVLSDKLRALNADRITLETSPEDCERLTEAMEAGRLHLVLRSKADRIQHALRGATEKDILAAETLEDIAKDRHFENIDRKAFAPPPPPIIPAPVESPVSAVPADPVKWVVEVFSGATKQSCEVPNR